MSPEDSPPETDRRENGDAGNEAADDEDYFLKARRRGCSSCSWMPCFGRGGGSRSPIYFQRMRPISAAEIGEKPWWTRGWKKVRAWSELVAGPRWKTFIRRFNRRRNNNNNNAFAAAERFRYDELSYSLNFDARLSDDEDDDLLGRDFSSRFASVPPSSKSSADLGAPSPAIT